MRLHCLLAIPLFVSPLHAATGPWKFDFGSGKPATGFTAVHVDERYDDAKGLGFDLIGKPVEDGDHVTGLGGYFFSLAVPEGCYEVTVVSAKGADLTVKAESRRLMLEGVHETSKFTVHVRQPAFPGGSVKLKDREKPYLHWDNKLTLEFNGPKPDVDRVEIRAVEVPVIHILGDSTVTDQSDEPWNSWGQMLPRFFGPAVAVANHAESGESIRSSLGAKRFEKVYRAMKKGDYVMVQFGHNDMKDKRPDALETYRSNLVEIVKKVRDLGGTPVLITSMERKAGVKNDTLGGYPDAVRSVAKELDVAVIDLHAMSRTLYQALGDKIGAAFQDGTHHNNYGSYELAKCVVEGIRTKVPELGKQLRPEVTRFDPARPDKLEDFHYPVSPMTDLTKPDGN
jgi:lysophospholipase L1-like esterase